MSAVSSFASSLWELSKLHPGVVLVLVGVAGEGVELLGRVIWRKRSEKIDLALEGIGLFFWVVVVIGLVMEISEAVHSDNEVIALNQKIEATNPLNAPIQSVRADVFLLVRGDFSNDPLFFPNEMITNGTIPIQGSLPKSATFIIFGKGGGWLDLDCDSNDSSLTIYCKPGEVAPKFPNARRFSMVFSWPSSGMASLEMEQQKWNFFIVRNNISTAELDKDGVAAGVQFSGFHKDMEVISGTCSITINGGITRKFSLPKIVEDGLVGFATMEKHENP